MYQVNFGQISVASSRDGAGSAQDFRLALLGDFSARANRGELGDSDDIAARKPIVVDVDNLDDVIERMGIELDLPLDGDEAPVKVTLGSMDDFHPDELYENLEIFSELSGLRQRLNNSSTFAKAAEQAAAWVPEVKVVRRQRPKPRGSAVPTDRKLDDFARLVGRPTATETKAVSIDDMLRRMVGPFVVPEPDPRQESLVAAVDEALSDTMRRVLHHPDFQTIESLWRSVDMLTRRIETGKSMKILLYDISAEELAADLGSADDLEQTGLFRLLVEQPPLDASIGSISTIAGFYTFEMTPPHADLLGRVAKIAAAAGAPFVAAVGTDCITHDPDDLHPLVQEAWSALRALPEAAYLGLATPRFLLRHPYGAKTDPVDPFDFEEFTPKNGLRGMLWGNPATLVSLLLAETFAKQGFSGMRLGSVLGIGDLAYYFYNGPHGDQVALPCTERLLTERLASHLTGQRIMPLLSIKGRPEARLGSFISLGGSPLAGPWGPAKPTGTADAEEPAGAETEEEDVVAEVSVDDDDVTADIDDDSGSDDDELAALLAGLDDDDDTSDDDDASSDDDEPEMDPELAALLAEL